jgi:hypothetical protein
MANVTTVHDQLAAATDMVREAITAEVAGREQSWGEAVRAALDRLEWALRQERPGFSSPEESLTEIDKTRPSLVRQVEQLRVEHAELLSKVRALRDEVERARQAFDPAMKFTSTVRADTVIDFGSLRQQSEQLLKSVQHVRETEADLLLESVNTDIGTGD